MGADTEMADAEVKAPAAAQSESPVSAAVSLLSEIKANVALIERGVATNESRHVTKVLRQITSVRKKLCSIAIFKDLAASFFPLESAQRSAIHLVIEQASALLPSMAEEPTSPSVELKTCCAEVEVYLHLLLVIFLIDKKLYDLATSTSVTLIERILAINSRNLDQIAAKAYFYYSRSLELNKRLSDARPTLLAAHRTACLRHDEVGQAMLLNLLLRNYLEYNLYDQADKLVSKSSFPEQASNNQLARYLYYIGRIKSIQLDYTEALRNLQQALRKAPQSSATGFRITVHKIAVIVQLLTGEIPPRQTFMQRDTMVALEPYYLVTQAVRAGSLLKFNEVVSKYDTLFKQDRNSTLIVRLRANVIKTGLRKISVSYSRISLEDVRKKLILDTIDEADCIVAKAIRDGVIEAVIDHDTRSVQSKENIDVYTTHEPQLAFHKRISFCLNIHNDAVKAMRFPPDAHKKEFEGADERRERLAQEQELAKNLAEEEDEDF